MHKNINGIIDMHCHIAGIGAGGSGCFVSSELKNSWRYKVYLNAFGVSEAALRSEGDSLVMRLLSEKLGQSQRVEAAVVLALDAAIGRHGEVDQKRTEMYIPNEYVARQAANHGNILFGASVNPLRRDAIERLERVVQDGAVLLKWLPSIQHIDPSDDRLRDFYIRLKELGLPLLSHTGSENSFTEARDELGDPERLSLPLELGVTVIAAHAASNGKNAGESNFKRLLRLAEKFPNLYADISALTQVNRLGQLQRALRSKELKGRLVYGTDMPLLCTPLVSAFAFPFSISPKKMLAIQRIKNPWDRDVAIKEVLGVDADTFVKASTLLKLKPELTND